MCWGDVSLLKTADGLEYMEFNERATKTRTGENTGDVRKVKPKMFSVFGSNNDPVSTFKIYAEKRPQEMNFPDAPFYLGVNNGKIHPDLSGKPWFKKSPVGVNKLNGLMKTIATKAGLGPNLTNHSGRKTMMQILRDVKVPPTDIVQLSGHKNLQTVI